MKTIAIIPARGGSKGVHKKNIRNLLDKPLINWTIDAALSSKYLDRVIVSTDDTDIAEVARKGGAEVPFMRPRELAEDTTPDLPVYKHALGWLVIDENYTPDVVVWLRPTSPLRQAEDIDNALSMLESENIDVIRSVCEVHHHPYWMKTLDENNILKPLINSIDENQYYQRQLLPAVYRLNGAVDVIRTDTVTINNKMFSGNIMAYVMPDERSVDIDTEMDFLIAESLLKKRIS